MGWVTRCVCAVPATMPGPLPRTRSGRAMKTAVMQIATEVASGKQCPYHQVGEARPAEILPPSPNDRPECGERQPKFGCEDVLQNLRNARFRLRLQGGQLEHAISDVAPRGQQEADRGGYGAGPFEQVPATKLAGKKSARDRWRNGQEEGRDSAHTIPLQRPHACQLQISWFAACSCHLRIAS